MAEFGRVNLTPEEYRLFHAIDRALYTLLVDDLWRDPVESLQVMGLWLCLEQIGFKNTVKKILSLPQFLINELADEASTCLKCIRNHKFAVAIETVEIPLTRNLLKKDISLDFFHKHRAILCHNVGLLVTGVCANALADILQKAIRGDVEEFLSQNQTRAPSSSTSSLNLIQPGTSAQRFVHKERYHSHSRSLDDSLIQSFTNMSISRDTPPCGSTQVRGEGPRDERTMFVTFSKGYPVTEAEVRQFFIRVFGNCIQSFHMQDVGPSEQPLYARVVFYDTSTIESILNGLPKAKFTINGKHVWMRKFVAHNAASTSVSAPPPPPPAPPAVH